jgi:hypothetical protein
LPEGTVSNRTIVCCQCREEFVFTAGEQRFYAKLNLTPPRRCPACREDRRKQGTFGKQVVSVNAAEGVVLCRRCRHPASRTASLAKNEALCCACDSGDELAITATDDRLTYEEWEAHFNSSRQEP